LKNSCRLSMKFQEHEMIACIIFHIDPEYELVRRKKE
jgi:hypothetical protein